MATANTVAIGFLNAKVLCKNHDQIVSKIAGNQVNSRALGWTDCLAQSPEATRKPTTTPVCPMRGRGLITRRSLVQIQPPQLATACREIKRAFREECRWRT